MSIGMDRFEAQGQFPTYNPFAHAASRVTVFQLQCRNCGYEPQDAIVPPRVCPKCHGGTFERYTRPGSILENANRYCS
jgi:rubrerythrin